MQDSDQMLEKNTCTLFEVKGTQGSHIKATLDLIQYPGNQCTQNKYYERYKVQEETKIQEKIRQHMGCHR